MQNIFFFLLLRSRPKNNVTEILSGNLFSSFGVGTKSAHFMISCFLLNFFFFIYIIIIIIIFFFAYWSTRRKLPFFYFFRKELYKFFQLRQLFLFFWDTFRTTLAGLYHSTVHWIQLSEKSHQLVFLSLIHVKWSTRVWTSRILINCSLLYCSKRKKK